MSMNSIPLFLYELSISKKMNMTSVFENNAANNAQNCTWHQKFSSINPLMHNAPIFFCFLFYEYYCTAQ